MYVNDIDSTSKNHENISEKIESISFNSIRKVLPHRIRDSHLFFSIFIDKYKVNVIFMLCRE